MPQDDAQDRRGPAVTVVVDPGGNGFYIERLWAFLAVHGDGDEGVVGLPLPGGGSIAAVAADWHRVESLKPMVEQLAKMTGLPMTLARFDRRTDVETFGA